MRIRVWVPQSKSNVRELSQTYSERRSLSKTTKEYAMIGMQTIFCTSPKLQIVLQPVMFQLQKLLYKYKISHSDYRNNLL